MIIIIMRTWINMENLQQSIQNRYKVKDIYKNKHKQTQQQLMNKYSVKNDTSKYIEVKANNFYSDITNKYTCEESEVYDKLYLKVRKLFLEMM